jgi:signal transduction histidine kinase
VINARQASAEQGERDQRRLTEEARRATVAREDLLAVVSHDLRNPLASIFLNLGLLMKPHPGQERRRERARLETIQRSAERMTRMIEDLLTAARIDVGGLAIENHRLEVLPVLTEALETMQPVAAAKGQRLSLDLPRGLPAIHADSDRVQQVLGNLLGNAIKFAPRGGDITLRAVPSRDWVTFSVTDSGPGVAADELPHLFDRYWQAKGTARLGTGLGLFIVKGIVEAHGGAVSAESSLGLGTTFSFTIPVAGDPAEAHAGV